MNSLDVNKEFNEQFSTFFSHFNFETCCLCKQNIPYENCSLQIYDNKTINKLCNKQKIEQTELQIAKYVPEVMQFSKKIGNLILSSMKEELLNDHKVYVCKKCNHPNLIKDVINETDPQISLIECEKCQYNFCNQCKQEPFHFGQTCLLYKTSLENITCRFCKIMISDNKQDYISDIPASVNVCTSQECQQLMQQTCTLTHAYCGHSCCGSRDETNCLPCIHPFCANKNQSQTFGVCSTDLCSICYTDELGQAPVAQLNCKHIFHSKCLATIFKNKYSTLRISFGYLDCPICGVYMQSAQCPKIKNTLIQERDFKRRVEQLAVSTAQREGIFQEQEYIEKEELQKNQNEYAMRKLAMYKCFQCERLYCGGRRDCEAELNEANQPKKEDLLCVYCYNAKYGNNFIKCDKHDIEYLEHKCQYCCSLAIWFCFGTTRFCNPCHDIASLNIPKICNPEICQWKGDHPPNGQPHCFGCKLCQVEIDHKKLEEKRLKKLAQQTIQNKQYQRYQAHEKWRNSWNIMKAFQDDDQNEEIET
eukprot:403366583